MTNAEDTPTDPQEIAEVENVGEEDPANLQSAEALDEDTMGVDPQEEGVEPPEDWSTPAGTTPREQRTGETLDERLAEERPDRHIPPEPREDTGERMPDDATGEYTDPAGEAAAGTALRGDTEDPEGLAANTGEGQPAVERHTAPEEDAERVEESGSV